MYRNTVDSFVPQWGCPPSPTSHPPSPHSAYLRYLLCSSLTILLPAERLRELFQLAHKKNNLSKVVWPAKRLLLAVCSYTAQWSCVRHLFVLFLFLASKKKSLCNATDRVWGTNSSNSFVFAFGILPFSPAELFNLESSGWMWPSKGIDETNPISDHFQPNPPTRSLAAVAAQLRLLVQNHTLASLC